MTLSLSEAHARKRTHAYAHAHTPPNPVEARADPTPDESCTPDARTDAGVPCAPKPLTEGDVTDNTRGVLGKVSVGAASKNTE